MSSDKGLNFISSIFNNAVSPPQTETQKAEENLKDIANKLSGGISDKLSNISKDVNDLKTNVSNEVGKLKENLFGLLNASSTSVDALKGNLGSIKDQSAQILEANPAQKLNQVTDQVKQRWEDGSLKEAVINEIGKAAGIGTFADQLASAGNGSSGVLHQVDSAMGSAKAAGKQIEQKLTDNMKNFATNLLGGASGSSSALQALTTEMQSMRNEFGANKAFTRVLRSIEALEDCPSSQAVWMLDRLEVDTKDALESLGDAEVNESRVHSAFNKVLETVTGVKASIHGLTGSELDAAWKGAVKSESVTDYLLDKVKLKLENAMGAQDGGPLLNLALSFLTKGR